MGIHAVLLGDSIFDNRSYVPDGPAVVDQLNTLLGSDGRATLVARDGDVATELAGQIALVPDDASHLVLSVGGNDALGAISAMSTKVPSVIAAMSVMAGIQATFKQDYRRALECVLDRRLPTALCTIYDAVPDLTEELKTALSIFNDVIVRQALAAGVHIIDLRGLCTEPEDYSKVSPIEPSAQGGLKIAGALNEWIRLT